MKNYFQLIVIVFVTIFFVFCSNESKKNTYQDYNKLEFREIGTNKMAYLDGKRYTGEAEYRMKDGRPLIKYTYEDGFQHGYYATWFSNGNMQKEGKYNRGKQHGDYKEYYESGKLRYHYQWDNDKKNGDWKSFYEGGEKWTLRQFKNDKLDGKLYVWDEQGRLGKEHTYKNGYQLEKFNHFENFPENQGKP